VLLEANGQGNLVEVVVLVNRDSERSVILVIDEKGVDGLVQGCDVVGLRLQHVLLDVLVLLNDGSNNTGVVDLLALRDQKFIQELGLVIQVESDGPVVNLWVGDLVQAFLELRVVPCHAGVLHHVAGCIVVLLVLHEQQVELGEVTVTLAFANDFGELKAGLVQLDVLHELLGLEFGVQNGKLGEDRGTSTTGFGGSNSCLHKGDELVKEATALVGLENILNLVSVGDKIQAAHLAQTELLGVHASLENLLPGATVVGFAWLQQHR